ncbi:MAG: Omp28-related outer membrane protein, partial [Bacteroidales bacterium]|nr:Omp28-related outer membrane protein [Bacteroidales bacterium]
MKKLYIISTLLLSLPLLSNGQTQRLVLAEEFTNASCGPCAAQNPAFDALLEANSDKATSIKYHVSWPGTDPMYSHNPAQSNARVNYYGVTGVPYAFIDSEAQSGSNYTGAPTNVTQSTIDAYYAIPSPFIINLSHEVSEERGSISVEMVVKAAQGISNNNLFAHIAVVEETITFDNPPGTNGETVFHNVMKKMLPDATGTALPASFNQGDSVVINEEWILENVYDDIQLAVVGFVQDNSDEYVQQAAYSNPIAPDYYDLTMDAILVPEVSYCGDSIAPVIKVENRGKEVSSMKINYRINDGDLHTYDWNGEINFLKTKEIILPSIMFDLQEEDNIITVYTSEPDGQDDFIPENDTLEQVFNQSPVLTQSTVYLELKTDNYGEETSWELVDSEGNVIYSGGNYASNTIYNETFELTDQFCYDFIIYDTYGDGICCSYGQGYYELSDSEDNVFADGGDFDTQETVPFGIYSNVGIDNSPGKNLTLNIYPVPAKDNLWINVRTCHSGQATIELFNLMGKPVLQNEVEIESGFNRIRLETAPV